MNINKVIIVGRVTADPQLKTTQGGQSVTSFSIATNRVWTDKGGQKQQETEFHNIVAWGRTAEVAAQYATKGSALAVIGYLKTREWEDKQGVKRKTTEIVCESLQLGQKPAGAQPASRPAAASVDEVEVHEVPDSPEEIDPTQLF